MINLYYYKHISANGYGNFGDELSPLIIERCLGKKVRQSSAWKADIVSIGSILGHYGITNNKALLKHLIRINPVYVWGSGIMFDLPMKFPWFMKFCAVRGKLTQAKIGEKAKNIALGDPGILAAILLERNPKKSFQLGMIPHYSDVRNTIFLKMLEKVPNSKIINICDDPISVIESIASCEAIVSSSLHGLIVADSLGIPNKWIEVSDNVKGNGYKFHDYYSLFDNMLTTTPLRLTEAPLLKTLEDTFVEYERSGVDCIQEALMKSFPDIS